MRLFIAIPFSDKFGSYMEELQNQLPEANMRLNKHFHLTLQFLGQVNPDKLDEIKGQLANVKLTEFKVRLEKLGVFKNNKGFIKVVWAGISYPQELKELQGQVEENMNEIDCNLDKPFSPHITLARVKFAEDKEFEEQLNKIKLNEFEETVDHVVLYQSRLSKEGPQYEELLTIK